MIITLFFSRFREGMDRECRMQYEALATELADTARTFPGFQGMKAFTAEDGERLTIVRFENAEDQRRWREAPRHRYAQARGRTDFYQEYTIEVLERLRHHSYSADTEIVPPTALS